MNLTEKEAALVFSMMRDLSSELSHAEVRRRIGNTLLALLDAEYFASYVWDSAYGRFVSCVQINMTEENLAKYESYFQFRDPITPTLQRRKMATPVSSIMCHERLERTEFYNDFLKQDGLCYGLNFFAYDYGENIGDLRIWRGANREDFTMRDAQIVDAIGPSLVNALRRARNGANNVSALRFSQLATSLGLTAREAEISDLMVIGLSDQQICEKLRISKATLRTHIGSIFVKSGLNRRSQLARLLTEKNHHL